MIPLLQKEGGFFLIEFVNITKKYKEKTVLKNINLKIETGDLVCIIGESGCGKTTLLRLVNRLNKPTSGQVLVDGKNIREMDVIKLRRNTGYVIQQTGLFPHMTIEENIDLIPKIEKVSENERKENIQRLMEMVGLNSSFLDAYPPELSGGQQQRVGIARAFAVDPPVILMDEPFSALDPLTKSDLQDELIELQTTLKKTIIFVTHDMDEAIKIADKICVMKDGNILQYDTPENILKNPVDEYVSHFVGRNRIWDSPDLIKVEDVMIEEPVTAHSTLTVLRCRDRMRKRKVDSLIIVDRDKNYIGIVKAKNLQDVSKNNEPISLFIDTTVPTLSPQQSLPEALEVVTSLDASTLPVVDEFNKLVGLLTRSSLVISMSHQFLGDDKEDA